MNFNQELTKLRGCYSQFGEILAGIETLFGTQKPSGRTTGVTTVLTMPKQKHRISAAGRKRISLATKARWAAQKRVA